MASMAVTPSFAMSARPFSAFRAVQLPPVAPDLPSPSNSSAALRRRSELVFVVNPHGANGRTGKEWKKLWPYLSSRLAHDYNISEVLTSGPSHGIDVTREAIREGADAVIAVGGDGTLHEVVNGFFIDGNLVAYQDEDAVRTTALGLIPLGTGSDFARSFGWKNDPHEAIERIAKGMRKWIDVGVILKASGEPNYFINVADIHLSAKAGYYASRYKRFGNLCYVIGALQAFMGHRNQDLRIKKIGTLHFFGSLISNSQAIGLIGHNLLVLRDKGMIDDGKWEHYRQVTALCIGNAKYFGGGMKITPNADPSSGCFEVVILEDFKWYDFILKLHRLYNGTHLTVKNVTSRSAHSIEVEEINGNGEIFIQSDGEHLGFLPTKVRILPSAIEMLT